MVFIFNIVSTVGDFKNDFRNISISLIMEKQNPKIIQIKFREGYIFKKKKTTQVHTRKYSEARLII